MLWKAKQKNRLNTNLLECHSTLRFISFSLPTSFKALQQFPNSRWFLRGWTDWERKYKETFMRLSLIPNLLERFNIHDSFDRKFPGKFCMHKSISYAMVLQCFLFPVKVYLPPRVKIISHSTAKQKSILWNNSQPRSTKKQTTQNLCMPVKIREINWKTFR